MPIEIKHISTLLDNVSKRYCVIKGELEDLLHNKVDVVTSDGLSKYVQPYIEKDKILIYEATD